MSPRLTVERVASAVLTLGVFYFSFMCLDRILSLVYGFNFQPYGPGMPPGFTFWGHLFNGGTAALGTYLAFEVYSFGERRGLPVVQGVAACVCGAILLFVPYFNDAEHLAKNGAGSTLLPYVVANALYVFLWGLLTHRVLKTLRGKALLMLALAAAFVVIHFGFYAPSFPEFYWS
jgi:hypothetical protein